MWNVGYPLNNLPQGVYYQVISSALYNSMRHTNRLRSKCTTLIQLIPVVVFQSGDFACCCSSLSLYNAVRFSSCFCHAEVGPKGIHLDNLSNCRALRLWGNTVSNYSLSCWNVKDFMHWLRSPNVRASPMCDRSHLPRIIIHFWTRSHLFFLEDIKTNLDLVADAFQHVLFIDNQSHLPSRVEARLKYSSDSKKVA
jgi:hypothetical protein